MPTLRGTASELRAYRNSRLYRPLTRVLRVYNRWLLEEIHARGFPEFSPAFPQLLANLDTEGTRIGVLAARAGVTRQAAGQLLAEIQRAGFAEARRDPTDARATIVTFTARGRELLATILELVEEYERRFERIVPREDLETVRAAFIRLADALDPGGALGAGDLPAPAARRRKR